MSRTGKRGPHGRRCSSHPFDPAGERRHFATVVQTNSDSHDAWFGMKVRQALEDIRPDVEDAATEMHFAERRATALRKVQATGR